MQVVAQQMSVVGVVFAVGIFIHIVALIPLLKTNIIIFNAYVICIFCVIGWLSLVHASSQIMVVLRIRCLACSELFVFERYLEALAAGGVLQKHKLGRENYYVNHVLMDLLNLPRLSIDDI